MRSLTLTTLVPLAGALSIGCAATADEPVHEPLAESGVTSGAEHLFELEADPSPALHAADGTPAVYACRLEQDFNGCIVERLEGRASTESELLVLIQSHRMLGNREGVVHNMSLYVDQYPDSPQTYAYRDYIRSSGAL